MINTPIIDIVLTEGSLESGCFTAHLHPRVEQLRFLTSERGMGNAAGTAPYGANAESYTFLGIMSPGGGVLCSTPVPLPDYAKFVVSGDTLTVASPVPVDVAFSPQGLLPLLHAYGERHRSSRTAGPVFGWSSWDHFNASVTQDDILANLGFIAADPVLGTKLTHIIVDDGWQTNWGEWTPNGKFPGGMQSLAATIHARGLKAGLWLAPLMVEPASPLYQRASACMLRDNLGHPYLVSLGHTRTSYALDVSVPRSQDFLRATFRQVRAWGYDYVKLDFLFNQAQCFENGDAFARDRSWSSSRHVRTLLAIAREELGAHVHILGCNYPFELGGCGIDEARVTNDIATFWLNVDFNYRAHAARFFMARRWFAPDPDYTVVRVPGATWTDGPVHFHVERAWNRNQPDVGWRKGPYWTEEEMKIALALVILSGGSVILGDHLPQLNTNGRRYVNLALEYGGGTPAWPLDLDSVRPLPCIFRNDRLLAFLNPFLTPLTLPIPTGLSPGADIFTGAAAPKGSVTVAPHTCQVFVLG